MISFLHDVLVWSRTGIDLVTSTGNRNTTALDFSDLGGLEKSVVRFMFLMSQNNANLDPCEV